MGRPLHSTTQQQQSVRPFIPAGRTSPEVLLRGRCRTCCRRWRQASAATGHAAL